MFGFGVHAGRCARRQNETTATDDHVGKLTENVNFWDCGGRPHLVRRETTTRTWFKVWGSGLGIWGLGFEVWGSGLGVWGLGFRVWGLVFGFWGVGFGVLCLRLRV